MVVFKRQVDEAYEEKLSNLNDQFMELKAETSEIRKKGAPTEIVELMLIDFPPKVKMAKATYEEEDIAKLKLMIEDIKKEIKEAQEGSLFSHVLEKVEDAYALLREDKFKEASAAYAKIMLMYKELDEDLKRVLYRACLDLKTRIENHQPST